MLNGEVELSRIQQKSPIEKSRGGDIRSPESGVIGNRGTVEICKGTSMLAALETGILNALQYRHRAGKWIDIDRH